jgi:signal transduction histidine kinase
MSIELSDTTLLRQQESLRFIIESISEELELQPLLTRIVHHACDLLQADRGTIGLVDEVRGVVRTEAMIGMPPEEMGAEMAKGTGLAGTVYQTEKPVVLNRYGDVNNPMRATMQEDAVIGLPIFWRDKMIGFFGIGANPPRRFNDKDIETLTLYARHAAIAIENARLFEAEKRRAARVTTLVRIGQRLASHLDLDDLFDTTVTELHERLSYDHVSLFLVDPKEPNTLAQRARASRWKRQTTGIYRQPVTEGILGRAARSGKPVVINDVEQEPNFVPVPGAEVLRAEMATPILLGERLLGVLDVAGVTPFTTEDIAALSIIADQLAIAIDHAQLFTTTQQTLEETRLLYETTQRISTASDVDEVIESYLRQIAGRGKHNCTVVLYEFDDTGNRIGRVVRGLWTPQQGIVRLFIRHSFSPDELDPPLDAGQTVAISDIETDPRVPESLRAMQRAENHPSLVLIPLMVRGLRIGLVILSHPQPHMWLESDLHPYQVTAAQLATAIDNRRQSRQLSEQGQQLAVFQERQRLARELHDSVAQLVFSSTLIAQSIAPAWRRDPIEGERRTARLVELSQSALVEMRALLTELRPPEPPPDSLPDQLPVPGLTRVQREGLPTALSAHIRSVLSDGLAIELEASTYERQPLEHEEALFRITQEALHNVIKHAHATHVRILLGKNGSHVRLQVHDNGIGFNPKHLKSSQQGNYGLHTMRERAEALGGTFKLTSKPGQGTQIQVLIPFAKSAS